MELRDTILNAWRTNNRVTVFLVGHLPAALWEARLPAVPRRTIRTVAAHFHNSRCMWIKTLGSEFGVAVPPRVDLRKVSAQDLIAALAHSSAGMLNLLTLGLDRGGSIPASSAYVWRNLPLDVGHVLGYFIAHEGHHRGQIVMAARQLGHRLPEEVTNGLWQWSTRAREG